MQDNQITNWLKAHGLQIGLVVVFLLLINWLAGHGFIAVKVPQKNTGEYKFRIYNSDKNKLTEVDSARDIKKLVSKGPYDVLVQNKQQSFFASVKTKGFLGSTSVQADLKPEAGREFIGDNPGPCMFFEQDTLFSYECQGYFDSLKRHVPATADQPTYVETVNPEVDTQINGIIKTDEGVLALSHVVDLESNKYVIYRLIKGRLSDGIELADLNPDDEIYVKPYKEGFITYDRQGTRAHYYESRASKPREFELRLPKIKGVELKSIETYRGSLMASYSTFAEGEDPDQPEHLDNNNEFILYGSDQTKHFTLKGDAHSIYKLCGINKLCALSERGLSVYDLSGNKLDEQFLIGGVEAFEVLPGKLLIQYSGSILEINPENGTGFISYQLGNYQNCGMQASGNNYLICLITNTNKRAVLIIDRGARNDDIDKKISELLSLNEVKNVTIYKNHIFISPELGELEFDEVSSDFDYNSEAKAFARKVIDKKLAELKLAPKYKVSIPVLD